MSALDTFVEQATACTRDKPDPADCLLALAPLMLSLVEGASGFLEPRHYQGHPDHYSRNLVYDAPDASLSLYTIVWSPGQWTPVHDHGSWGVVGVLEGVLEERSYVRLSPDRGAKWCLTPRSSGPPPAGRTPLAYYSQLRAASRWRPLSSNVRALSNDHTQLCLSKLRL